MTITAAFCPLSVQTLFDQNAIPIKGGQIFVYDAETTNPRTVYSDSGLVTALPTPVLTDGYGRIPPIFVGLGNYKVILKNAAGSLISSIDDLPGGVQSFDTPSTPSGFVTGDLKPAHTANIQDGWLPSNGQTIGNSASTATARANDDAQALFTLLWNSDATLVVSGGRGASATADWAAAKTIALPDYRGRTFCGVDQMGASTTAGKLTAFTTTTPDTVGTGIGAESETLNVGQLPVHTPAVTIVSAGSHSHGGATVAAGVHSHGGGTGNAGGHYHSFTGSNFSNTGVQSPGATAINAGFSGSITAAVGDHAHVINADGNHQHTINADGVHTHTATAASIGSGNAHSKVQPAVLGYWHIRL